MTVKRPFLLRLLGALLQRPVQLDPDVPIREQGVTRQGIDIGSDCWIGAKVTILDGVSLGRGCVIAAGSVVTRSFPEHAIIGGVPAKLLKMRGTQPSCEPYNQGEKTDGI